MYFKYLYVKLYILLGTDLKHQTDQCLKTQYKSYWWPYLWLTNHLNRILSFSRSGKSSRFLLTLMYCLIGHWSSFKSTLKAEDKINFVLCPLDFFFPVDLAVLLSGFILDLKSLTLSMCMLFLLTFSFHHLAFFWCWETATSVRTGMWISHVMCIFRQVFQEIRLYMVVQFPPFPSNFGG